jgi:hypothetical protein
MRLISVLVFSSVLVFLSGTSGLAAVSAQSPAREAAAPADDHLATVRGKLLVPEPWANAVRPDELEMKLSEKLAMEEPPLPDGWNELTPDKQMEWWTSFQQSEAGKQFVTAQQERFRNRRVLDAVVEPDGTFAVYDVPAATWDFRAFVLKELPEHDMLFEIFGELTVREEVDEVALGEMEIEGTPIFRAGDPLPDISWSTDAGELKLRGHTGKHLLVTFWNAAESPSASFQKGIQAAVSELGKDHPLELISVGLGQDAEAEKAFRAGNPVVGQSASADWDDDTTRALGVRSIPWLLVAGPDGKVLMSDQDLGAALRGSGLPLLEILRLKLAGKEIPMPQPPASPDGAGG